VRAGFAFFAGTLFASALLLFTVEPIASRLLTPLLGGAPEVWITCMLFFQASLLGSYAYANVTARWLGLRRQAWLHAALLATPLLALPIAVRPETIRLLASTHHPVVSVLVALAKVVGLPFFALGATAPLVQRWFAARHEGQDPYFLYGASNLGSLVALVAYPLVIERTLGLSLETKAWSWAYGGVALLVAAAALTSRPTTQEAFPSSHLPVPSLQSRARWVAYAFVPSSLLLGATTYLTTDVAPIPLLWVVPLALYLLSFVLCFARRPPIPHARMVRLLPLGLSATVMLLVVQASTPMSVIVLVHLATLFLASMVCHGELAKDRPDPAQLLDFYLCVSVGGVLGGAWSAVLAPVLFHGLTEYPVALVLAALCRRTGRGEARITVSDMAFGALMLVAALAATWGGRLAHLAASGPLYRVLFTVPLLLTYREIARPTRYALGLAGTLVGSAGYGAGVGQTLHAERSFFGVVRVTTDDAGRFTQLAHGTTIHGRQWRDEARRDEPTAYYTREGPLGEIFTELRLRRDKSPARVAVVGLGAGAMAAYAAPEDSWAFYEINASVIRLATDPTYFTFLEDAFHGSPRLTIVPGDARLSLAAAPARAYDLLVIDAFSSDTVPAHLLTREAMALYEEKLDAGGLLVLHVSNRYLDLVPVVASLARDQRLSGFVRRDNGEGGAAEADPAWSPSVWTAMTRAGTEATILAHDPRWQSLGAGVAAPWTDDFTDIVGAIVF
jgi:hypothetical protein